MTKKKQKEISIVATSDLHGKLDGLEQCLKKNKPDILVIAGDIQPADIWFSIGDNGKRWFRDAFFEIFRRTPKTQIVAIPGNHDFVLRDFLAGKFGTPEERKKQFRIPDNFHLLCDSEATVCGLRIYGTPWVPWISGHWCWEVPYNADHYAAEEEKFKNIPEGLDILITHTPPTWHNSTIDVSLERVEPGTPRPQMRRFGSLALLAAINEKKPLLVFCGHIHSGEHKCQPTYRENAEGNSFLYNVSRLNERYEIAYPFRSIVIKDKVVEELAVSAPI